MTDTRPDLDYIVAVLPIPYYGEKKLLEILDLETPPVRFKRSLFYAVRAAAYVNLAMFSTGIYELYHYLESALK
jgi:hypothetical protein